MPVFTIRIERSAPQAAPGRRPRPRLLVVLASTAVVVLAVAGLADAVGPSSSPPSVYTAIAPRMVLHGRILHSNGVATPVIAGGTSPVPASATSVVVGVDLSGGTTKGTLDIYPTGGAALRAMRWTVGQAETQ